MIGKANRVLCEGGVVVAVGVGGGWSEILQIISWDCVSVGAERCEGKSGLHGFEGKRIDFDGIENVFAALLAGEEVVDPGKERVASELERMPAGIEAQSFSKLGAMFARGTGKLVGAANAIDDVGDFDQRIGGVGVGLAEITRELGAEVAEEARSEP